MSRATALATLLLAALAVSTAPAANAAPDFREEILTLSNAERAKNGCNVPLKRHTALDTAAQGHAVDMATQNYFSHTGKDGSSPFDRTKRAGYPSNSGQGENIAAGYSTPEQTMKGWMSSPGHRRNILNCKYKSLGIGYTPATKAQYKHYWVQNFGTV